jgi:hypothetical protein
MVILLLGDEIAKDVGYEGSACVKGDDEDRDGLL